MPLSGPCPENITNWDTNNGECTYVIIPSDNNPEVFVIIEGNGKFNGLIGCGTRQSVEVGEDVECEIPIIMPNGQLCGNTFTDIRDENEYTTVQIGDQCWVRENLRYTTNECLNATWNDSSPFNGCSIHSTEWGEEVLYQWGAAMDGETAENSQGLCPDGWYIPSDDDFKELELYLGMTQAQVDETGFRGTDQGTQLKDNVNWNGTNTSGFSALPSGTRTSAGSLNNIGDESIWWSSTPFSSSAWRRSLNRIFPGVHRHVNSQASGFSVRCILK